MSKPGPVNSRSSHASMGSAGRDEAPTPCKTSCCKTPFGHSTVRDQIPSWHRDACHCHDVAKITDQLIAALSDPEEQ